MSTTPEQEAWTKGRDDGAGDAETALAAKTYEDTARWQRYTLTMPAGPALRAHYLNGYAYGITRALSHPRASTAVKPGSTSP